MISAFEPFGVTQKQIETFCQCRAEAIKPAQVVRLRNVYQSLRDGMSSPTDWFEPEDQKQEKSESKATNLKEKIKARKEKVEAIENNPVDPLPMSNDQISEAVPLKEDGSIDWDSVQPEDNPA